MDRIREELDHTWDVAYQRGWNAGLAVGAFLGTGVALTAVVVAYWLGIG